MTETGDTRKGSINGEGYKRITFKKGDVPITLFAIPAPGYIFDRWEASDDGGWGDRNELTINDSFLNGFADGTTFEFYFERGTRQYTITIKGAAWRNNSWSTYIDQKCKVGIIGDLTSGDYSFQATEGSSVAVYAEGWNTTGAPGDGQYVNGFYTKDHTLLKQSPKPGGMPSWTDTYTFTVTGEKEIYVDFANY